MNISSEEALYNAIFDIVNNMNIGLQLITSQEQRNEVAQLNLTAGMKAKSSVSIDAHFVTSNSMSVCEQRLTSLLLPLYFSSLHSTLQQSISWSE